MVKLNTVSNIDHMIKYKYFFILYLLIFFLNHCSLDRKTGIWTGHEKELERIAEMEKANQAQSQKIFSTKSSFDKEIASNKILNLNKPKNNRSWPMSGLNLQNSTGHLYLEGIESKILKKKIGKDKFEVFQRMQSPLFFENNIILTDDKGSIYRLNKRGQIYWRQNIYNKIYKKLYKNLSFSLYNENIYISDNIGFVYAINYKNGELIWKKNFGIPFKSNIKVFENKIFVIDQDNRILSLKIEDGSKTWDIQTIQTFIKSQNLLGIAISKKGNVVFTNSAGDLIKINSKNGRIYWSINSLNTLSAYSTDFFKSSGIVIDDENVFFSSMNSTFSVNLNNGYVNWIAKLTSSLLPVVDGNNVFLVTDHGYFINLDKDSGKPIWSTNILKNLKRKKQNTIVTGFVLGSGKIYATTLNGYLIVSSATNGKIEFYAKIASGISASPVIVNGEFYVLTSSSKILGFK